MFRSISVIKQRGGLSASHHKSQTCEAVAGAKGRRFYSDAVQPGRMLDFCLKGHVLSPRPKQKVVSRVLFQFLIQIFGALRQLLSGHICSLACSSLLFVSGFLLEPQVRPLGAWAMWLLGPRVWVKAPASTFTRWAREHFIVPWDYISLDVGGTRCFLMFQVGQLLKLLSLV